MSILDWQIAGAPLACLDVETTGFVPGRDRIIEIAVVHLDDAGRASTALDTLIHPLRDVPAGVHRLTVDDLAGAPRFADVAGDVLRAIAGRILVAHNAYFDVRMLSEELTLCGATPLHVPFLCSMHLRPALGLGPKEMLPDLCAAFGIDYRAHAALDDALAVATLMNVFRAETDRLGLRDFSDLGPRMPPACTASWAHLPLPEAVVALLPQGKPCRPRTGGALPVARRLPSYGQALLEALADTTLSPLERQDLERLQRELELPIERIRACHAAAFAWFLTRPALDGWVDGIEADVLERIRGFLAELGWAPGDAAH